jgi:hypothetical protein
MAYTTISIDDKTHRLPNTPASADRPDVAGRQGKSECQIRRDGGLKRTFCAQIDQRHCSYEKFEEMVGLHRHRNGQHHFKPRACGCESNLAATQFGCDTIWLRHVCVAVRDVKSKSSAKSVGRAYPPTLKQKMQEYIPEYSLKLHALFFSPKLTPPNLLLFRHTMAFMHTQHITASATVRLQARIKSLSNPQTPHPCIFALFQFT